MHKVPASYPYGACSPTVQKTCFSVGMHFLVANNAFSGVNTVAWIPLSQEKTVSLQLSIYRMYKKQKKL